VQHQVVSFVRLADSSSPALDATQVFDRYHCTTDLTRMCQALLDRAADLADAALQAGEAARRYAEETVFARLVHLCAGGGGPLSPAAPRNGPPVVMWHPA
jgi:hypothetical protein